ncbi:single-stranded DNA-binding protein, partial [Qipengyuania sp.]
MTNIAILTGRIARDPDTRETKGGTNVTGITVVTDRPARDK